MIRCTAECVKGIDWLMVINGAGFDHLNLALLRMMILSGLVRQ
jgi:hypothetical protein